MTNAIEQSFAAAINADPDDRTLQLVYADWLDEQGDPRAEGWRVLIEAGKRPFRKSPRLVRQRPTFRWYHNGRAPWIAAFLDWDIFCRMPCTQGKLSRGGNVWICETHFEAMADAATAWVRCHRDAEFEPDELEMV